MPTDWVVYDKGINLYMENQDEGIRLIVHPWMTTDKADRIALDLNSHAALVEALERSLDIMRAIVDQRAIAEQSRHLTEQARIDIRLELFDAISDAQLALADAKGTK